MNQSTAKKSIDPASLTAIERAKELKMVTAWDRSEEQKPQCQFGELGICCRICEMGPCRIDPFGEGPQEGICGADSDTIVARHLIRQIAAGVAAHSDHGRDIVHALKLTAAGEAEGYSIKNPEKLISLAQEWEIPTDGKSVEDIAKEVAKKALTQWTQQEGELLFAANRAPKSTLEGWRKNKIVPRGVDREIVETLHRTHEGVDSDYKNLLLFGCQTALADGWGGAMIATELGDILFGQPKPVRSQVNLGVLKNDEVNIVVHGHEPTLSEMVVAASNDKELLELAAKKGAKGIMVGGICCTANEILMRQGAPVVGNFLNQELAIATGAVDLMLVDVQCIMPSLASQVKRFHTKLITTSPKAKIKGAVHMEFDEKKAYSIAKEIIKTAIENYPRRGVTEIPDNKTDLVAGFTVDNIFHHLGGRYRGTYRPLNDAIISGRIRGVAAVIGCNTVKKVQDDSHIKMVTELLKNDVLVVMTGCAATACAKLGLLQPESAKKYAGKGIQEVCEAVGIPPVLHLGSCVDNSRILMALVEIQKEGGLGDSLASLPAVGAAPEAMCEKAIAIGFYAVASGCFVSFSPAMRVLGSKNVTKFLTEDIEDITGGKFCFEEDPIEATHRMIDSIDKKRRDLKLKPLLFKPPYNG